MAIWPNGKPLFFWVVEFVSWFLLTVEQGRDARNEIFCIDGGNENSYYIHCRI